MIDRIKRCRLIVKEGALLQICKGCIQIFEYVHDSKNISLLINSRLKIFAPKPGLISSFNCSIGYNPFAVFRKPGIILFSFPTISSRSKKRISIWGCSIKIEQISSRDVAAVIQSSLSTKKSKSPGGFFQIQICVSFRDRYFFGIGFDLVVALCILFH